MKLGWLCLVSTGIEDQECHGLWVLQGAGFLPVPDTAPHPKLSLSAIIIIIIVMIGDISRAFPLVFFPDFQKLLLKDS